MPPGLGCPRSQRLNSFASPNPERRKMGADRVGDVGRGQMRIVLLSHPSIGVAKLFCDNAHRHALHGERRAVGRPQTAPTRYFAGEGKARMGAKDKFGRRPQANGRLLSTGSFLRRARAVGT